MAFESAGDLGSLLNQIVQMLGQKGLGQTTPYQNNVMRQMQQMFTNPLGSGIFKGLVGTVLNALRPQEALAQQRLTDTFRAAGGASPLQSGAFAKQAQMLQGNFLEQEANAISGLAQNSMSQLMNALQMGFGMGDVNRKGPLDIITLLLNALGHGVDLSRAQTVANSSSSGGLSPTAGGNLQSLLSGLGSGQGASSYNPYFVPGPSGTAAQYSPGASVPGSGYPQSAGWDTSSYYEPNSPNWWREALPGLSTWQ